jgi:hypothetical protein
MLRPDFHRTWSYLPRRPLRITERLHAIKEKRLWHLEASLFVVPYPNIPQTNRDPGTPPRVPYQWALIVPEIPAFWLVPRCEASSQQRDEDTGISPYLQPRTVTYKLFKRLLSSIGPYISIKKTSEMTASDVGIFFHNIFALLLVHEINSSPSRTNRRTGRNLPKA